MLVKNIGLVLLVLQLVWSSDAAILSKKAQRWNEFKARFAKRYQNSTEETRRQTIYESNRQAVEEFNAGASGFKLGLNEFADQTLQETLATRTGLKGALPTDSLRQIHLLTASQSLSAVSATSYSNYLSYVNTTKVSNVKNQGSCGSCWAFAVTQAVEGQTYKAFGRMISPSEQQLVDCDKKSYGCNGGYLEYAYGYMAGGVQNSSTYTYLSGSSGKSYNCSANSSMFVVSTKASTYPSYVMNNYGYDFGSFVAIPDNGTGDLNTIFFNLTIAALNDIGPLTIGVCVGDLFYRYAKGVYDNNGTGSCNNSYLNHAVLLVGYDMTSSNLSEHYWIVKNQWGTGWGANGYINIQMRAGLIRKSMYPVLSVPSTTTSSTSTSSTTTTTKSTTTSSSTTRPTTTSSSSSKTSTTTVKTSSSTQTSSSSSTTSKSTTVCSTTLKTSTPATSRLAGK